VSPLYKYLGLSCPSEHLSLPQNFPQTYDTSKASFTLVYSSNKTFKMFFNTMAVASVFVASALAAAEPAPYMIGKMSLNTAFGLMKRQAGYQPTQTYCGPGADCASSCGAGYVQCPSSDGDLHCYDPTIQQTCCPDGTGNSCAEGFFCTEDASGNTWCCPNVFPRHLRLTVRC
jgi:hypothetical protein